MVDEQVWSQLLADKILADLPEELAAGVAFKMHEGGDALVVGYPGNLECTPEFKELDVVVRRYGGAWVSRGTGKSYYLVPRPKAQAVALPQPVPVKSAPEPEVPKGIVKGADVAAAKAAIPGVVEAKPAPVDAKPTASQSDNRNKVTEAQSAKVPEQPTKAPEAPKQPSPIMLFQRDRCSSCQGQSSCDITQDLGRFNFAACLQIQEMELWRSVTAGLQKLADRPAFRGGQRKDPPKERHVDGGVSWFWNEAHTYEKALDAENRDSKEFAVLKKMLTDAASAGKKGLVIGDYWCFLDSFKKDGVLRKKAQDFSNGGASK